MNRDLIFRLHESSRGQKYPGRVDVFAARGDEELGESYATVSMDLIDDLDDLVANIAIRVRDGKTVRCRLQVVE